MEKKKNTTLLAVLITAGMIFVAALVIGLSLWAEHRREGSKISKNAASPAAVDSSETVAAGRDGGVMDYQKAGNLVLGDYSGIEVDPEPSDDEILAEIEQDLLKMTKKHKGRIRKGDYVCIDYKGFIDGQEYEELTEEDVVLRVGDNEYGDEFEKALIGRQPGDICSPSVTYGDEYEELSGETVKFKVTVKGRFDDYYADKFSKGKYPTVEKYVAAVKTDLEEQNAKPENSGETAWETLMEESDVFTYPDGLVEEEVEITKKQYEEFADLQGITYEEMLESFSMDEDSLTEIAEDMVKERLVAKTIAAREGLVLDDAACRDYLMETMEYTEDNGETLDDLLKEYREGYGTHPKDDMLIQHVKAYIGAKVKLV